MNYVNRTEEKLSDDVDQLRAQTSDSDQSGETYIEALAMTARGIAHDIRNLMASILGNAALVQANLPKGHPSIHVLTAIENAAEETGKLTQGLTTMVRDSQQKLVPVNLNRIAYNVLLAEEQQLAPRIRIVRYTDPDIWEIAADATQLTQMLQSLTLNAVEAISKEGQIVIRTRNIEFDKESVPPETGLRPGRYAELLVEDDGQGMSAAEMTKAFKAGISADAPLQVRRLAAAFRIVKGHQGHMAVSVSRVQGTTVRVYLPAYEPSHDKLVPPHGALPTGSETILIVDDERMLLEVMSESLSALGYQILTASNGQEAVEIAKKWTDVIHLTLLDMSMPVMGGVEAFPLLRQARPEMKVIICTGLDQELVSHSLIDVGASAFLLKPFRPSTLAQTIRKALDTVPAQ